MSHWIASHFSNVDFSFWVEGVVGQSVLNLVFRKINHLVLLSILNLIYEFFHF